MHIVWSTLLIQVLVLAVILTFVIWGIVRIIKVIKK